MDSDNSELPHILIQQFLSSLLDILIFIVEELLYRAPAELWGGKGRMNWDLDQADMEQRWGSLKADQIRSDEKLDRVILFFLQIFIYQMKALLRACMTQKKSAQTVLKLWLHQLSEQHCGKNLIIPITKTFLTFHNRQLLKRNDCWLILSHLFVSWQPSHSNHSLLIYKTSVGPVPTALSVCIA